MNAPIRDRVSRINGRANAACRCEYMYIYLAPRAAAQRVSALGSHSFHMPRRSSLNTLLHYLLFALGLTAPVLRWMHFAVECLGSFCALPALST